LRLLLRLRPVAGFPPTATGFPENFHSPSGFLHPSGSTLSFRPADRPASRLRPISSRSPPLSSFTISGDGSTFLVRYVTEGLLFLKPLGTSFTMPWDGQTVNVYLDPEITFPQETSRLFRMGYGDCLVTSLWKKQRLENLFRSPGRFT
jgi:hypothetical protein